MFTELAVNNVQPSRNRQENSIEYTDKYDSVHLIFIIYLLYAMLLKSLLDIINFI